MARRRSQHPRRRAALAALQSIAVALVASAGTPAAEVARPSPPGDAELAWRVEGEPAVEGLLRFVTRAIVANAVEAELDGARLAGFSAGTGYPQLWIRDSATIVPTARYLFGAPFLTDWIRAHLRAQAADGALQDWIAVDGSAGRNSAEADQEAALVQAAATATAALGPGWLDAPVAGRAPIERLDAALTFVLRERGDPATGLVTSGHTADWGDVTPEFPDARATDLHPDSVRVVGIYTQAMLLRAMTDLAGMHAARGDERGARDWRTRADGFRTRVRARLWDPKRGFFRVHRHLDGGTHAGFDEADMFALGGNVVAARAGLADAEEARGIAREALRREQRYGMSAPAGVLLPPYPAGFFQHPWLDETFEYQNGGQWDWFGGRLVLLMFELGMPEADAALRALARKVVANGGFHEWDTASGEGRGSGDFAGGAGVLGQAVVEGLFGVRWRRDRLELTPRLGTRSGAISLSQPATGERVAYRYLYDREHGRVAISLSAPGGVPVAVQLPDPPDTAGVSGVSIDGTPVAFERERGPAGASTRIAARPGRIVFQLR